jgi:hypothetical protein
MSAHKGAEETQQLSDLERLCQMGSARELDRLLRRTAFLFSVVALISNYLGGLGVCFDQTGPTWF